MTDKHTAPDWRDHAAYDYVGQLTADARRWEFLRRSTDFRKAYAEGRLSNPTIARMRFCLAGTVPHPSTRGDWLSDSFGFATKGELARIGASRPAKPLPSPGPTIADFRVDLTRSIGDQVEAIRAEAERLAAALAAEWSAQEAASTARRRAAGPFAQLATQVTAWEDKWEQAEEGAPTLNPRKPRETRASVKLLQVLDALDEGAYRAEIAEVLFGGHPGNASTAVKEAKAAAKSAAKSWP